jgi:hypothetical protein
MCEAPGMNRSGFYAWLMRPPRGTTQLDMCRLDEFAVTRGSLMGTEVLKSE